MPHPSKDSLQTIRCFHNKDQMRQEFKVDLRFKKTVLDRLLLSVAGILFSFVNHLHAHSYHIGGFVTVGEKEGLEVLLCSFTGSFFATNSIIEAHYFNGEVFVSGSDGVSSFTLNRMATAKSENANSMEFGYVNQGPFPEKNLTPVQLVWLACAFSRDVSLTLPVLPLECFPMSRQQPEALRMETRFQTQYPFLPKEIRWFAPGFLVDGTNRSPLIGYADGYLAGEFSVVSRTNLNSIILPAEFRLVCYSPRFVPSASFDGKPKALGDVVSVQILKGYITNLVDSVSEKSYLPELKGRAYIQDGRFQKQISRELNYIVNNHSTSTHHWRSVSDPFFAKLLPTYGAKPQQIDRAKRICLTFVISLIFGIPVLILGKRRRM